MSLTRTVIDFVVEADFRDFSKEVVEATKKLLIDTIGVALGGSGAAGVEATMNLLRQWGGNAESTIWVFGDKLPSLHAAFMNSMMVHALDFDDTHGKVAIHSGATVIPTALATAESVKQVSGKDLITAIVVGVEVASKLGLSILEQDKGWHLSATCGTFASSAVAGKLLGLDHQRMGNALGIGYTQTSGTLQSAVDGSLTKRMQPGFSSRSGILSALLAREGITGPEHFFEGPYGFFKLYQDDRYDPQVLIKKMGLPFEIVNLATKPYPCCRLAHSPLDALFRIMEASELTLDDVEAINIYGSQAMKTLCGKPFQSGVSSAIDAQFSLSYIMVSAIARKVVGIDNFSREAVRNPVLAPHTQKVNVFVSPDIRDRFAARVEIKRKDGSLLTGSVDIPKGQPENPMSWEECVEKFNRCSMVAAKPLNQERLKQFIQGVEDLENIDSVQKLIQLLT
jgi:2-methylcitrate dehydratase PrpD